MIIEVCNPLTKEITLKLLLTNKDGSELTQTQQDHYKSILPYIRYYGSVK